MFQPPLLVAASPGGYGQPRPPLGKTPYGRAPVLGDDDTTPSVSRSQALSDDGPPTKTILNLTSQAWPVSLTPANNSGLLLPLGTGAMPNIVHFEICVDDLRAAATFYSTVFGWQIEQAADGSSYWNITTGAEDDYAITGGLTTRFDELNPTINTIDVPSLDSYARKITEAGGRVLAPKFALTGLGYVQYCQDLEGNTFGIIEYDGSAS